MPSPVEDLIGYWRERVERDLRPFADPGTELSVQVHGRAIDVTWVRRDQVRSTTFHVAPEQVTAVTNSERLLYRSFFASEAMGDVLGISKVIARVKRQATYAATKAKRLDQDGQNPIPATDALLKALDDNSAEDATLVVVATGEAGAGKTSVLTELVRRQADAYLRGKTDFLFLYINAQGRALARFDEALATELQDMRAGLTYHAIPCLVRLGLIVPVVDGFDELLGIGGYEDAFSSLSAFIEELDGHGKIIASARSTYYEQEFVQRANKKSALGGQVWTQIPVQVLGWGEEEFDEYVRLRCADAKLGEFESAGVRERVAKAFSGDNSALRVKPFFVAQTVDLVLEGAELSGGSNLLEELVAKFLERERTQKLTDTHGGSLLTVDQLEMLLVELAEEMWNQETRELDKKSVSEVAEYVIASQSLPEAAKKIVIEKMPKFAFLRMGERESRIAFEHETFFSFFLANSIVRAFANGAAPSAAFLARSVLPEDVSGTAARHLWASGVLPNQINDVIGTIGKVAADAVTRADQVRENAGLIVGDVLKSSREHGCEVESCEFRSFIFGGNDLGDAIVRRSIFSDVEFRRTNLARVQVLESEGRGLLFVEPLVSLESTRLEIAGVDPNMHIAGLRVVRNGVAISEYRPETILSVLADIGMIKRVPLEPRSRAVPEQVISLVERFARSYQRRNPICTDDAHLRAIFQDAHWPAIQRLLIEERVVTEETRASRGPAKVFLRRQVQPEHILIGTNPSADVPGNVRKFWERLEAEFVAH